ncbi:hypothetical protein O181_005771 [Austropuccinia psidii MF-1]|uniref:Uncharacterized protein n=1 Tax=Austropuccinia psidii MF-1 TaxID=1389203 RepID=A0A9Q3BJI2_9BASI|nr:hypothetical protein [Austropuccinia psidii MF-1]
MRNWKKKKNKKFNVFIFWAVPLEGDARGRATLDPAHNYRLAGWQPGTRAHREERNSIKFNHWQTQEFRSNEISYMNSSRSNTLSIGIARLKVQFMTGSTILANRLPSISQPRSKQRDHELESIESAIKSADFGEDDSVDSFDASSLLLSPPNVSTSTFLHTNQDQSRFFRQLNAFAPSPATQNSLLNTQNLKRHNFQNNLSQISSSSNSSHHTTRAMTDRRMAVSNERVPPTLYEETSQELRESELETDTTQSNLPSQDQESLPTEVCSDQDQESLHTEVLSDQDQSVTFYGCLKSNDQENNLHLQSQLYLQTPHIAQPEYVNQQVQDSSTQPSAHTEINPSTNYNDPPLIQPHSLAETVGIVPHPLSHANNSSIIPISQTHLTNSDHHSQPHNSYSSPTQSLDSEISKSTSATFFSRQTLSQLFGRAGKNWLGLAAGQSETTNLDSVDPDTPPTSPGQDYSGTDHDLKHSSKMSTHLHSSHVPIQPSYSTLKPEQSSHISSSSFLQKLPPVSIHSLQPPLSANIGPENATFISHHMSARNQQTPKVYSRPSSAPPFNKTPSFIPFDRQDSNFELDTPRATQRVIKPSPGVNQLPVSQLTFDSTLTHSPIPKPHTQPLLPLPSSIPSNQPLASRNNPPWLASLVKTPSKLQFSFVPTSPSNVTLSDQSRDSNILTCNHHIPFGHKPSPINPNFQSQDHAGCTSSLWVQDLQGLPSDTQQETPPRIKANREFEKKFLQSPVCKQHGSHYDSGFNSGEARIFRQSNQTSSIVNVLNGQSCSNLQDQTLTLLTPSESFGLEFSSPIGLKDWSIHHSPIRMDKATKSEGFNSPVDPVQPAHHSVAIEKTLDTVQQLPPSTSLEECVSTDVPTASHMDMKTISQSSGTEKQTQPYADIPQFPSVKDGSFFGPHLSQISPLPHFSPLSLPNPNRATPEIKIASDFRPEESPLAIRTQNRGFDGGKMNCLTESIIKSKPIQSTTVRFLEPAQENDSLTGFAEIQVPDRAHTRNFRLAYPDFVSDSANTSTLESGDVTLYHTPNTSLIDDKELLMSVQGQPQMFEIQANTLTDGSQDPDVNCIRLVGNQGNSFASWNANSAHQHQILISIAQNLKQDLLIKDQMVKTLQADKEAAEKARDFAQIKISEVKRKIKAAAKVENTSRNEKAEKIELIVSQLSKLISGIENMTKHGSTEGQNPSVCPSGIDRLQNQLQQSKTAMKDLQPLLKEYASLNNNLKEHIPQQTEDLQHTPAAQILAKERVQHLQQALEVSSAQCEEWKSKALELKEAVEESKLHHDREVSRLKIEIEDLSKKYTQVLAQDQDVKNLKDNIRMLEEEAQGRMEALSKFRSQSHALQDELKAKKKTLTTMEHNSLQTLEEVESLRNELKTAKQKHQFESERNAKMLENEERYCTDRAHMKSKLQARDEQVKQLKAQLQQLSSTVCTDCEAKDIKVTMLEEQRNNLQTKLTELRAQLADQEGQIVRLRKNRNELQEDVEGLNIALQAKQQENAFLKRDKVMKKAGMNNSTSVAENNLTSRARPGKNTSTYQPPNPSKSASQDDPVKALTLEDRLMLSSITNIQRDLNPAAPSANTSNLTSRKSALKNSQKFMRPFEEFEGTKTYEPKEKTVILSRRVSKSNSLKSSINLRNSVSRKVAFGDLHEANSLTKS